MVSEISKMFSDLVDFGRRPKSTRSENILEISRVDVPKLGKFYNVVVSDFGFARAFEDDNQNSGQTKSDVGPIR